MSQDELNKEIEEGLEEWEREKDPNFARMQDDLFFAPLPDIMDDWEGGQFNLGDGGTLEVPRKTRWAMYARENNNISLSRALKLPRVAEVQAGLAMNPFVSDEIKAKVREELKDERDWESLGGGVIWGTA